MLAHHHGLCPPEPLVFIWRPMFQGKERRTFPAWKMKDFAVPAETLLLQPIALLDLLEPTIMGEEIRTEEASADLAPVRFPIPSMVA